MMKDEKRQKGAHMIDITDKADSVRVAVAAGEIELHPETIKAIKNNEIKKGDVLTSAQIAAVMAVKNTPNIIPLCHPIPLTSAEVEFDVGEDTIESRVTVKSLSKTGVEMEALTGVCVALLNIWDMVKYLEKDETGNYPHTRITNIRVLEKVKRQQ